MHRRFGQYLKGKASLKFLAIMRRFSWAVISVKLGRPVCSSSIDIYRSDDEEVIRRAVATEPTDGSWSRWMDTDRSALYSVASKSSSS
ncbi:hypothetical protein M0802_013436 [Mischocyttarus mexicanus]|nr:hypothetical protein M0802_013443 [Mischocyttarus mexicanus]KAI4483393.1 hypothetical protein M0802_013436 [Mischocyttarus mexicanus]